MAHETLTKGPKPGPAADEAALAFKVALLEVLKDPEIVAALREALGVAASSAPRLGASDAEQADIVVDLIERIVRPDALRRLPARSLLPPRPVA